MFYNSSVSDFRYGVYLLTVLYKFRIYRAIESYPLRFMLKLKPTLKQKETVFFIKNYRGNVLMYL